MSMKIIIAALAATLALSALDAPAFAHKHPFQNTGTITGTGGNGGSNNSGDFSGNGGKGVVLPKFGKNSGTITGTGGNGGDNNSGNHSGNGGCGVC